MQKLLMTLHIVTAIFVIGPLVAAANQAARVLKDGDAGVASLCYLAIAVLMVYQP
jgi:hypothetical protein